MATNRDYLLHASAVASYLESRQGVHSLPESRFTFDQPYESASLLPQEIREDFSDLCFGQGMDPQDLLDCLASYLPADKLAEFMDDLAMGRV
jgi:hypothetical protein